MVKRNWLEMAIFTHRWCRDHVGEYDVMYECAYCGATHSVQDDNPEETALPIERCPCPPESFLSTPEKPGEDKRMACCVKCNQPFKPEDYFQVFLRSPDDEKGSWTKPIFVDYEFQNRVSHNGGLWIPRAHPRCLK